MMSRTLQQANGAARMWMSFRRASPTPFAGMLLLLCLSLAVAASCALSAGSASAATGFERVGAFAEGSPDGQPAHQRRIAVNHASSDVYVTDPAADQVAVYRPNGTGADALTTFGSSDLTDPLGIAIDQSNGDVYVSDSDNITKYTSDGAPTPTFTKDNTFSSPAVTGPLAFDATADQLLVADTGADVVRRFSTSGTAGTTFDGTAGTGSPGAFAGLQDLAVDSTGDIIVVDSTGDPALSTGTSRVERFAANGNWEATIGPVPGAATVAVRPDDDDEVLVSDKQDTVFSDGHPTLHLFTAGGTELAAPQTDAIGSYSIITGIAGDDAPGGQLFVATDVSAGYDGFFGNVGVQVYDPVTLHAPTVAVVASTAVRADRALLGGRVNANRLPTTYRVEYGLTASYGSVSPATGRADAGSGAVATIRQRLVVGLDPGTTYHFRLVATNALGTATSPDQTFTTTTALPGGSGRAYEQVSPADKNFNSIFWQPGAPGMGLTLAARDGNAAVFSSWGVFAGSENGLVQTYRSRRTSTGWVTTPGAPALNVDHPDAVYNPAVPAWVGATPDLSHGLISTTNQWSPQDTNQLVIDPENPFGNVNQGVDTYVRTPDDDTQLMSVDQTGRATGFVGMAATSFGSALSRDGSTTVFTTSAHVVAADAGRLGGGYKDLYARRDGHTQLVGLGVDEQAASACGSQMAETGGRGGFGVPVGGGGISGQSVSTDGRRIVFQTPFDNVVRCDEATRLFVRIDGDRTVSVSGSQRSTPDPAGTQNAVFIAAADDGSRVVFGSTEMLTDDAPDPANKPNPYQPNLYSYDVASGVLKFVYSGEATILAVNADASRLFITTTTKLADGGKADAPNIYALSVDDGTFTWVATAESGDVYPSSGFEAQYMSSADGHAFLFVSSGDLLGFDSNGRDEAYLYRDGRGLMCVSCGASTTAPTTHASIMTGLSVDGGSSGEEPQRYASSLSADGNTVAFTTGEALLPSDVNDKRDVYEWRDGQLSLVSPGTGSNSSYLLGMSRDTTDIFFVTADALVAQDRDGGDVDMYTARRGGGFSAGDGTAVLKPCAGDACQGTPAAPAPPAPVAGSVTFVGPEGTTVARTQRTTKASEWPTVSKIKTVHGTSTRIRVKVPAKGKIAVLGGGLAASNRTATKAGTYSLTVRLSQRARRTLTREGRLKVKVAVWFTPSTGTSSTVRVNVTFAVKRARAATALSASTKER